MLLLVLLGAEAPSSSLREAPARIREAAALPPSRTSGFWFDPDYAAFLEALRRATPDGATIALSAPQTTDLYVYRAVYDLVPRRIVPAEEWESADYVAVYGSPLPPSVPAGAPVPGGTLLKR